MRASTELKPFRRCGGNGWQGRFTPQPMGIIIFIIIAAAFAAGELRRELALTLTGAVFLAAWAWCLIMTLLLALLHRRRALSLNARISPREIAAGTRAEAFFSANFSAGSAHVSASKKPAGRFFRLPAILIRYHIKLKTLDDRHAGHIFDPDTQPSPKLPRASEFLGSPLDTQPSPASPREAWGEGSPLDTLYRGVCSFEVPLRGAYYSAYDELAVFDVLGFFRFVWRLAQDSGPRLLVSPHAAEEPIPVSVHSGGTEQRNEPHYRRTDDLIDHRPYIPGDDPRRINWKLYSHGGDLFVREGEPEPPPHSRLLIMVDTQCDPTLYNAEAGRLAVDKLCENALAAALEYAAKGMDVLVGYTGGEVRGGTPAELAAAFAWPAAIGVGHLSPAYPEAPDRGFLILALPRTIGGNGAGATALDRFLKKRDLKQGTDLIFLYEGEQLAGPAETCAAIYGQKGGVHARRIRLE